MQTSTIKTLSGKQARFLRGLGHSLRPAVMIGRQELTETILTSLDESLTAHELVKVKLQEGCLLDRREVARILAEKTASQVAQVLGKTILLYRAGDQAKINLP